MRFLTSFVFLSLVLIGMAQAADLSYLKELVEKEEFPEARDLVEAELGRGANSAEIHSLAAWTYANLIGETDDKDEKMQLLDTAIEHIKISLEKDNSNAWSHFCYAVIHALKAERESNPKRKLQYVKLIKEETDIALTLDPELPEGYYLLGRWHLELSSLSWVERVGADLFLGGFPDGVSMEASFENLHEAIGRDPECIIYNLGLAQAYMAERDSQKAEISDFTFHVNVNHRCFHCNKMFVNNCHIVN